TAIPQNATKQEIGCAAITLAALDRARTAEEIVLLVRQFVAQLLLDNLKHSESKAQIRFALILRQPVLLNPFLDTGVAIVAGERGGRKRLDLLGGECGYFHR